MTIPKSTRLTLIPVVRYRDAHAAIEWLCTVLGFEAKLVVPGENNTVLHAQLTFGNGMLMLGTIRHGETDHVSAPEAGICLIVNDADELYSRAVAAGAEIVMEIQDQSYGGRSFTCGDPEGHSWHIGTYDPWEEIQ